MTLEELRLEIDNIDRELVALFSRRMEIAGKIAACKKASHLPVLDAEREEAKLAALRALAAPEMADDVAALYSRLFELSRGYQTRLLGSEVN